MTVASRSVALLRSSVRLLERRSDELPVPSVWLRVRSAPAAMTTCVHCGRIIVLDEDGVWVDPEATGDDSVWRETCDAHDTFIADHQPVVA